MLYSVYFGNGCFWGRQKDFVDVEMRQLGRSPESLTALVGYAAGTKTGPGGKVCYVYSDPRVSWGDARREGVALHGRTGRGEGECHVSAAKPVTTPP